ncbi:MAG: DHH family phosphoesterase [Desulfurococcales archaeon]|nr:DHH family phosphoesterase [Desulfurococcales archaeon]
MVNVTIRELVSKISESNICLVTHKNADPDAVSSAIALYFILKQLLPVDRNIYLCFPQGMSTVSRRLLEVAETCIGTRITYKQECTRNSITNYSLIILDTANPTQLDCFNKYLEDPSNVIVIDHHRTGTLKDRATLYIGGEDYSSTAEIVTYIIQSSLTEEVSSSTKTSCLATLLMSGIIYDTRRFQKTGPHTFYAMSILQRAGGNYASALSLLEKEADKSQRMALLKACQRLILNEICGLLVAGTHVGSFESAAARTLVNIGADVAIVLSDKKDYTRIALRSRSETIDVSEFALWLSEKFGGTGSGGGHFSSALFEGSIPWSTKSRDKKVKTLLEFFGEFCIEWRKRRESKSLH